MPLKKYVYLIFFVFFSVNLNSQYIFEWHNYYDNNAIDQVTSLTKSSDGNMFIVGLSQDSTDALWLVKINQKGEKLWSKLMRGYKSIKNSKIIQTYDKNLLISATVSEQDTAKQRIWVTKIDYDGNMLWERIYSGQGIAFASDVIQTVDSGYAIAGYTCINDNTDPDWDILKLDSLGYLQWEKITGSSYDDRALSLTQMLDSTIVVVGFFSYSFGGFKKGSLTKINLDGDYVWAKDLKLGSWSTINSVAATTDSNFVIAAEMRYEPLLNFNTIVMKMTTDADTVWSQKIDAPIMEHPVSIIETYDQGYAIAYTWKADGVGNVNVAAMKISPLGTIIWQKVFYRKSDDYASQMIESSDNSLVIGASTYSLDKSWNYGIVKFRSIEASDLKFNVPYQPTLSYYEPNLPVDAFIIGYKKPKELKIYINRQILDSVVDFKIAEKRINSYIFKYSIPLTEGLNTIDFVVTDYKDYKFVRTLRVFYVPKPTTHW